MREEATTRPSDAADLSKLAKHFQHLYMHML